MDFTLSPEQLQLQDGATRFMRAHSPFDAWRAQVASGAPFSRENWARMAELGWLGINIGEDDGGLGGTPFDTMALMLALGGGLSREPFVSACVIAPAILRHAPEAMRRALLPAIAQGKALVALALAEEAGHFDFAHVTTRAAPPRSPRRWA